MKVLLLEIPSADHAFEGWLGGRAIQEIFSLLRIDYDYKLILSKLFLINSIKDVEKYDVIHIECHSDEEGICYNPSRRDSITWESFARLIMRKNDVKKKQLIISGCLAGNTQSTAKVLAQEGKGFKRVFAFDEEIDFDKAIAIWSGFYYLLSPVGRMSVSEIRQTVKKLCECFDVKFLYFYPSRQKPEGVNVYNGKK